MDRSVNVASEKSHLPIDAIAKRFGISTRTVRRYLKKAADRIRTAKGESPAGGARRILVHVEDFAEFVIEHTEKHGEPASHRPIGNDAGPEIMAALQDLDLDAMDAHDLDMTRERMARMESMAYEQYQLAQRAGDVRRVKQFSATITTITNARRQLEKEMPLILHRRGRYVDAFDWGSRATEAANALAMRLDQLGMTVAADCEGKDVRQIREIIDQAVMDARAELVEVLCQITGQ